MNKIFLAGVCLLTTASVMADTSLSQKFAQTKEAVCYNHPNKELCIDGINALMKGVKAASDTHYACLKVQELGESKSSTCNDVEGALGELDN